MQDEDSKNKIRKSNEEEDKLSKTGDCPPDEIVTPSIIELNSHVVLELIDAQFRTRLWKVYFFRRVGSYWQWSELTREISEAESWSWASEAKEQRSTLAEAEEKRLKLDSRAKITESGLASRAPNLDELCSSYTSSTISACPVIHITAKWERESRERERACQGRICTNGGRPVAACERRRELGENFRSPFF